MDRERGIERKDRASEPVSHHIHALRRELTLEVAVDRIEGGPLPYSVLMLPSWIDGNGDTLVNQRDHRRRELNVSEDGTRP